MYSTDISKNKFVYCTGVTIISNVHAIPLFGSPDPSVVRPLTFSYFNLLLWNNLAESIYIRSSIKFLHFVPFRQQIWPPRAIIVSDWLMLKKSSPLKLLGQMEPNLAGSIYVRSSIKLLHLVPFGQETWPLLLKIEHMVKLQVFGNNS